jgi:hypothetical protein
MLIGTVFRILVGITVGTCVGLFARERGYSFFAWFFTGVFGFIVLALLPDAHEVKRPLTIDELTRLRRWGNCAGIATSILGLFLVLLLQAFLVRGLRPH